MSEQSPSGASADYPLCVCPRCGERRRHIRAELCPDCYAIEVDGLEVTDA